jgi:hypothetical protein
MSYRTAVENELRHDAGYPAGVDSRTFDDGPPETECDPLSLWAQYIADGDYRDDIADLCANAMNGDEAFKKLSAIRSRFDSWCERREARRR